MSSKFQSRLIGTIVLVVLGIIILPWLLDKQKKNYSDKFAAIPFLPKSENCYETDVFPLTNLSLPTTRSFKKDIPNKVRASDSTSPIGPSPLVVNDVNDFDSSKQLLVQPKQMERLNQQSNKINENTQKDKSIPISKSFIVQLGALKNAYKVNELVNKLRSAGYRVYTLPSIPVQDEITRILVGPFTPKNHLKNSLSNLKKISGLNGLVVECR